MAPCTLMRPVGVARQVERRRELQPEAAVRQPDHPHAVDRAVEAARANLPRIGLVSAGRPMKSTVHAAGEMLVDQHAEMAAALQHALHGEGRALPGRLEAAHGLAADLVQHTGGRRLVRRAEHRRGVEPEAGGADRRQLPIGEMGREDQAGLAVLPQAR